VSFIDGALLETRKLRDATFTDESVSTAVWWECLVDAHDERSLRCFLYSLAERDEVEPGTSTFVTSRVIALKTDLLQHIISLQTACLPPRRACVTQKHFAHCLRQSCFLLEILPKLRGGYFALHDGTVSSTALLDDCVFSKSSLTPQALLFDSAERKLMTQPCHYHR